MVSLNLAILMSSTRIILTYILFEKFEGGEVYEASGLVIFSLGRQTIVSCFLSVLYVFSRNITLCREEKVEALL